MGSLIEYPGKPRGGRRRRKSKSPLPFIIGGAVVLMLLVSLIIFVANSGGEPQKADRKQPAAANHDEPANRPALPRMSYKEATELLNSETEALERLEKKRDEHLAELDALQKQASPGEQFEKVWGLIQQAEKFYGEQIKEQKARVQEAREARERAR